MSLKDVSVYPQSAFAGEAGYSEGGMTLRQHFAGLAMQGILSDPDGQTSTQAARTAVLYADALLAALEEK